MNILFSRIFAFVLTIGVVSAANASAGYDVPLTLIGTDGVTASGLWVVDPSNLSAAPLQIVTGALDGAYPRNMATLSHWQFNASSQEWLNVTPYLQVYGYQGQLYADSIAGHPLHNVPFSNGRYGALCSLEALDTKAHSNGTDFIVATVVPAGVNGSCGTASVVNWLIPGDASPSTAPVIEPAGWTILGALSDLKKDSLDGWVVSTGSEVDVYDPGFLHAQKMISGIPSGARVLAEGQYGGTVFVMVATVGNGSESDVLYAVAFSGYSRVYNYSYLLTAPCAGITVPGSREADEPAGLEYITEPTSQGYAAYALSLTVGTWVPQQIYADSSGTHCGNVVKNGVKPGGHAFIQDVDLNGNQRVIAVAAGGPAAQSPVVLASGDSNQAVTATYVINGNAWISIQTNPPDAPQVTYDYIVKHWNGVTAADYPNGQGASSLWQGITAAGSIDREFIYVFAANPQPCTGGSLLAVDPNTFTTVAVSGVPSDTCQLSLYGWAPVPVGDVNESGSAGSYKGNRALGLDSSLFQLVPLAAQQSSGQYTSMFSLSTYPFL